MSAKGQVTRFCPWLFGSCMTFAGAAAPGQVSPEDMIDLYRVGAGSASTQVYAITGVPLAHSASPAMHNAAFAALGMDAIYVPLESDDADELLEVAAALGVLGVSVTAPLKPAIHARMHDEDEVSRQIGAVNTVKREPAGWSGRNFDVAGFLDPLRRRRKSLKDIRAVVLGSGGTARTATWALNSEGARVEIAARRSERGIALAAEFGATAVEWPPTPGWDLLVNTTPVGTWPQVTESPLEADQLQGRTVYDLVYNPADTRLMTLARAAGAEAIGGREMLVGQAAHQFEWWTGRTPPVSVMDRAAERFIEQSRESRS